MDQHGDLGEGIAEPVGAALLRLLRRAVLDHALAEPRRAYPPVLHVGLPGGHEAVLPVRHDAAEDHSLRTDVVAAMVHRTRTGADPPLVWLTRPGPLDLQDLDAAWLAAARAAYAEAGLPLTLVVVDRHGWRDPRSGCERRWARLRRR